jgi:lambda family phage minor tail protein L
MRIVGSTFKKAKNAPTVKPIYLYSILYDETSNSYKRYTSWPGGIEFDGIQYDHYPIRHGEFKEDASGKIQKSSLTISNVSREIQALIDDNDGLRNKQVTITQVWFEHIGDASAFISDSFIISDTLVTEEVATFTLASPLDVLDIRLPRRSLTRVFCRFRFKGDECAYAGAESTCNKTLQRCRELENVNRFGGFPATPLQRQSVGSS